MRALGERAAAIASEPELEAGTGKLVYQFRAEVRLIIVTFRRNSQYDDAVHQVWRAGAGAARGIIGTST